MKERLVLVGNGMAGMRAIEELLKLEPDLYDITVFGAEPHPNYNRILLSPVLSGEKTVGEIVEVKLARPRDRVALAHDPEFAHYRAAVFEFLYRKQMKKAA